MLTLNSPIEKKHFNSNRFFYEHYSPDYERKTHFVFGLL